MTETLSGKRILVVEDEYFIALEIKRALQKAGATVVGPLGNLRAGLAGAEETLDGAVLDVNLSKELSYPIADRLRARRIPFMFLTGYDGWSLPPEYRGAARLAKPFATKAMVAMVAGLVAAGRDGS